MNRLAAFLALAAAAVGASAPAGAGQLAAIESASGVAVQASIEGGDRLVVAVVPQDDILLNGRLGVAFEARDDAAVWADVMPRLVVGEGDYFAAPVLETLALLPDALGAPAELAVTFGACLPVTGICVLEEALLTLTPGADGAVDVTLAAVAP